MTRSQRSEGYVSSRLNVLAIAKAGVLRIDAVHQDVDFTKTMTTDVDRAIADLARWLELDLVSIA